jgi:hypothetical protein
LNAAQDIAPDGQRGPFPPTDATHTSTAVTSQGIFTRKKQHIRVKKTVFPLEKRVFSIRIRSAGGDTVSAGDFSLSTLF